MSGREYAQGVATLGFPNGGPSVRLRLNPRDIRWNFEINTNVTETVGGRVVQVLGATLSDITVLGSFGERRLDPGEREGRRHGYHRVSWDMAEDFVTKMKTMAEWQSRDARRHGRMHTPAIFSFPPRNWRFAVYIKDLTDPDGGGAITHRTGKFAHDYALTLFIHADLSDTSHILGRSNGVIAQNKDKAIQSYVSRIANGIGWRFTEFNGPGVVKEVVSVGGTARVPSGPRKGKEVPI